MRRLPVPLLLALALLAGCTFGDGDAEPPGTVTVLAGSELRDVEPLLGQIRDATGVNLKFEYSGTLEGAERITAGGPGRSWPGSPRPAIWPCCRRASARAGPWRPSGSCCRRWCWA